MPNTPAIANFGNPLGMGSASDLKMQHLRCQHVKPSIFPKGQQRQDRFRFEGNPDLGSVIQRTLKAAIVHVNFHSHAFTF
jgi:hypothetical protein